MVDTNISVFICGCGRSGTTYLKAIIDAHPDVFIPTESLFLADYLVYEKYVPIKILTWFFFQEPQLKSWYSGGPFQFRAIAEAIRRVHSYEAELRGARIWGQKTPRFIRFVDVFDQSIENIKWIFIYRDPRAVVSSMLHSKTHTYSIPLACKRWRRDNKPIVDLLNAKTRTDKIHILKYEDLISHFDESIMNIFKFLDMDPIPLSDIETHGQKTRLKGSKFPINTIREGFTPNQSIVCRWKKDLSAKQIERIEHLCRHEMRALGYSPLKTKSRSEMGHRETSSAFPKDMLIVFEYLRNWPSYLFFSVFRKAAFLSIRSMASLFGLR